jgi:hypothetical protein
MAKEQQIAFGDGQSCTLELEAATVEQARDPELFVSVHPVRGLRQGELSILVTRTYVPAIVRVELADRGSNLRSDELEQIRKTAEGIFRLQTP